MLLFSACKNNQSTQKTSTKTVVSGLYRGILPCADCEGLQTEIKFDGNSHYELLQKSIGKESEIVTDYGEYKWLLKDKKIQLKSKSNQNGNLIFEVEDNQLVKLTDNATKFPDDTAGQYLLRKELNADYRITGKYWKLIELNGQVVTVTDQHLREPYFILRNDKHTLNGHGGCNAIFGFYEIKEGNRIKFGTMASTMKACFEDKIENSYFKVFEKTDNYSVKNDTLSFNKARMAPLAKFKAIYLY